MLKRRHFLQCAGSTLAAIGLSQLDLTVQGNRYSRLLAQGTSRKLALLVGINQYPDPLPSLEGCSTDVVLQRELLINRYGFHPSDVLTITNETAVKPTRAGILEAFEQHLIQQARPGDVVVFHYSGHGSRVTDPDPIPEFNGRNGTLVPLDGRLNLPLGTQQVNDIMGRTLFLLTLALQTENVAVVVDSCHSGGGIRGNVVVRSLPSAPGLGDVAAPSELELTYQKQWMSRLNLSPAEFQEKRRAGIAKGMALGSAHVSQLAADVPFEGFHAGAFTYLLTRYLWQQTSAEPIGSVFVNLARNTQDVAQSAGLVQDPVLEVEPGSNYDRQPAYFLNPIAPAAEAVVRQVSGNQVEFWLGGISAQSLAAFEQGAVFSLIDREGQVRGQVEQTGRDGLVGRGILREGQPGAVQAGTLMREKIRGVPATLSLKVGLDASLGAEAGTARSLLQSVDRVEPLPVNQQSAADYLLGRMTESALQQVEGTTVPSLNSIGLFTISLVPVADSFGQPNESMTAAIDRLRPRLKMLLAGRLLGSIHNSSTSDLKVDVQVQPVSGRGRVTTARSRGASEAGIIPEAIATEAQQLAPGTEIQVHIQNNEARNLYVGVLTIASSGEIALLHPVNWNDPEAATLLPQGQSLIVPSQSGGAGRFRFIARGPAGFFELLILASTEPLRDTLRGLQQIAGSRGVRSGNPLPLNEDEPVEIVDSLLSDLDRSTRNTAPTFGERDRHGIDTSRLAAISVSLEVVE